MRLRLHTCSKPVSITPTYASIKARAPLNLTGQQLIFGVLRFRFGFLFGGLYKASPSTPGPTVDDNMLDRIAYVDVCICVCTMAACLRTTVPYDTFT
jgi:hypothetical protein